MHYPVMVTHHGLQRGLVLHRMTLFNDTHNTFDLWLLDIGHIMVKHHSDMKEKPATATSWAAPSNYQLGIFSTQQSRGRTVDQLWSTGWIKT